MKISRDWATAQVLIFDSWSWNCPGEGDGNPLQYSCLENPMDRGAWRATVCRVTKSQAQLKRHNMHTHLEPS